VRLGYGAVSLLDCAGNGFLGFAVLCGAAFVFYRSKRASLFLALGGVVFMLANAFEWVAEQSNMGHIFGDAARFVFPAIFLASHVALFGALALALHAIARQVRA
jgi:hypothetical protein